MIDIPFDELQFNNKLVKNKYEEITYLYKKKYQS